MKKILSVIFVLLILGSAVCVADEELTPRGVLDVYGVLTDSEKGRLESLIDDAYRQCGTDFLIVTVEDFTEYGYYGIEAFAEAVAFEETTGHADSDRVCVFAVSFEDRDFATYNSQPVYDIVAGNVEEYIEEEFLPLLSSGDYYDCFSTYVKQYSEAISLYDSGELVRDNYVHKNTIENFGWFGAVLGAVIVGFIVSLIVVNKAEAQLKSVRYQDQAQSYVTPGSLNVTDGRETFLYSAVSRTARPRDTGSSSRSGGHSYSGGSHGGGGRSGKF